jgi:1,4-dihydroxy-2-naphthoate octaprenyltransferase
MEVRAPFLTASILPVVLGTAVAWHETGAIEWGIFYLTLLGGVFLHIGANVANDFFDHKSGCDENNSSFVRPFTGGSRMIQRGLLTPKEVIIEAIIFFVAGSVIGFYLAATRGYPVLVLGMIGVFSGYFYTAPPLRLASHGAGEVLVGLNFGTLMTLGAYYVQAQQFSKGVIIASVPLAVLIAAVLYINEFQDAAADSAAGKKHLVVRLGKQRAAKLFAVIVFTPYVIIAIASAWAIMPSYALFSLCAIPFSLIAVRTALLKHSDSRALVPANAMTVLSHLIVGVLLILGYIFDR